MSKNGVIIALLAVVAVTVPVVVYVAYAAHVKERRSLRETRNSPVVTPQAKVEVEVQVPREKIINPATCIFKAVGSLSAEERAIVLQSAKKKVKAMLDSGGSFIFRWITIYAEPMTKAEAELVGDDFLEEVHRDVSSVTGLKMSIYWTRRVGQACLANDNDAESQFYNSFWDRGKRVSGAAPRAFDEVSLYKAYMDDNSWLHFGKLPEYDAGSHMLRYTVPVETMIELIYRTFAVLHDTGRDSPFDRMPRLKAVRITYTDKAGQEIGGATYDFKYWSAMRGIVSVPYEVSNQGLDEEWELGKRREAKLITEKEFKRQFKAHRQLYNEIKSQHYEDKWLKLIPLVKGFTLEKELPLRGKKPFF